MQERDLLEQFIRVERGSQGVRILVRKIVWDGPHTPRDEWVIGTVHTRDVTEAAVHLDALELLNETRFFGLCSECGARKPVGRMHAAELCQAGGSDNHGVVY